MRPRAILASVLVLTLALPVVPGAAQSRRHRSAKSTSTSAKPTAPPASQPADKRITLLGEVAKPGLIDFATGITFKQAVEKAGGFTARADAANVQLRRIGASGLGTVDGQKALDGDAVQNILLHPGDTLHVPARPLPEDRTPDKDVKTEKDLKADSGAKADKDTKADNSAKPANGTEQENAGTAGSDSAHPANPMPPPTGPATDSGSASKPAGESAAPAIPAPPPLQVAFMGEVAKPGRYYYEKISVKSAIAAVGGLTKAADSGKIVIKRNMLNDPLNMTDVKVDFSKVLAGKAADVELEPGDVVQVPNRKPDRSFFGQLGSGVGRLLPPGAVQKQMGNVVGRMVSSERLLRAVPFAGALFDSPGGYAGNAASAGADSRAATSLTPLESALIQSIQSEPQDVRERILRRAQGLLPAGK
jgi:protein involved in polysaccharide export with SLBB domain